ncbi:hypothetical protein GCM10009765_19550 [Fodinicola feengrottensis]|uniref:Uncharacterized protein n=1 Tax=Fodinicola feengrottensis TaxID=435914 RepID=A0ABP4SB12_9ACTN
MALSVVEDSRVRLDGVVRDLAAVPDWAACWQPLDQPYGVEYANRIAAVTSWDPVAVVQLVSGQDLRSVEFTSPSGRHLLAAPAAVRPVPTWIWSVELDKEAATDDLVTSGRVQARAALDEAVQQLSERLGQPTGEPVWVDPDGAPAGLMMGHPGFVVGWQRTHGVIQLDVWEDAGYLMEPWTWEIHLRVRPDLEAAR